MTVVLAALEVVPIKSSSFKNKGEIELVLLCISIYLDKQPVYFFFQVPKNVVLVFLEPLAETHETTLRTLYIV